MREGNMRLKPSEQEGKNSDISKSLSLLLTFYVTSSRWSIFLSLYLTGFLVIGAVF